MVLMTCQHMDANKSCSKTILELEEVKDILGSFSFQNTWVFICTLIFSFVSIFISRNCDYLYLSNISFLFY